jgi:uncharacterized membrane-anchored protein YjiN (DUF445 family)
LTDSARELITWILPPVLGAIIGYVTNAVAIKMLFRPHREWRVFGVRLPFTPGIIPRQRYKLAENIGSMVSKELLTEDTLVAQVQSPKFRDGLEQAVSGLTGVLLKTSVRDLGNKSVSRGEVSPIVEELVRGFLRSKGIKRIIHLVIRSGLSSLTERKIGELFRDEDQRGTFVEWIYGLLRSPETGNRLATNATRWLEDKGTSDVRVGDYLPKETIDWIVGIADVMYAPFFGFVLDWLRSDGMRKQLEVRGRFLLRDILDKLNVFQRFLVAATQYDRTLDEKMPDIIEDVIASMKEIASEESTREKMLETIGAAIANLREQTIGEADASYKLSERLKSAFATLQKTISEDPAGNSLKVVIRNILGQLEGRSIESFLEHALTVDDAAEYLADMVSSGVGEAADRISRAAVTHLGGLIDQGEETPIGELLGLTGEVKLRIDRRLAEMAGTALETSVPGILSSLDLNEMVVAKINGLAVEDVEGLLLRVIHRHLKWINVFGAILGFLIGMIQIITRLL